MPVFSNAQKLLLLAVPDVRSVASHTVSAAQAGHFAAALPHSGLYPAGQRDLSGVGDIAGTVVV